MLYFSFSYNYNGNHRPSFRLLLSVRTSIKNDCNQRLVHKGDKKRTDSYAARVEEMILEMWTQFEIYLLHCLCPSDFYTKPSTNATARYRQQWISQTRAKMGIPLRFISFRSPYLFYLLTVGVEVVLFSLDHTQTHTTVGRTPRDEGSARRRDLYLTTQTLYKR
jgi:hypothetical protein